MYGTCHIVCCTDRLLSRESVLTSALYESNVARAATCHLECNGSDGSGSALPVENTKRTHRAPANQQTCEERKIAVRATNQTCCAALTFFRDLIVVQIQLLQELAFAQGRRQHLDRIVSYSRIAVALQHAQAHEQAHQSQHWSIQVGKRNYCSLNRFASMGVNALQPTRGS